MRAASGLGSTNTRCSARSARSASCAAFTYGRRAISSITAKGVVRQLERRGFQRQYQVVVDPQKLQLSAFRPNISDAIRASNQDVGGRTIEMSETEYMIRGRGYLRSLDDLGTIVLKASASGTPVLLRDVARVQLGPDERRGIAEWTALAKSWAALFSSATAPMRRRRSATSRRSSIS